VKFKDFFYEDEFGFKTGDTVFYNKKEYIVKSIVDGLLELIDATKTRGKSLHVDPKDIDARQEDLFGGGGSTEYKKRNKSAPRIKPQPDDSEQQSLF